MAVTKIDPEKLPPGHAIFAEEGKNSIIAYEGKLFNPRSGEPLPLDFQWLKDRNYSLSPAIIAFLGSTRPKKSETKKCASCHYAELTLSAKFCPECGNPQPAQLVKPGEDSVLEEFLKAMDPSDPFAAFDVLVPPKAPRPVENITPEEMARIAYQEGLSTSASGVPGEPPRATAARGEIKTHGQVSFSAPPRR